MIRILIAAAYPTVRAGLKALLHADHDIEVVGEAAEVDGLLKQAVALQPDVVLLELGDGNEELANSIWQLAEAAPTPAVVLLCDANDQWSAEVLHGGVRGILPRDATASEIVAAVVAAGQGLMVLHPTMAFALLITESSPVPLPALQSNSETLTPREAEVLHLLSEGLGNKAISRKLHISEHTVKFHVGAIMAKFGASSRTEAVTMAARRGLILL